MAFRIQGSVVRGEIDNRIKGSVCGTIWVAGRGEPFTLELKGNALPDLAGCQLAFSNPNPPKNDPCVVSMATLQRGTIGDLTASRKVRVFDVPKAEVSAALRRGMKPPERMANSLYLEWFSAANGRVVIESVDMHVTISPPEWRLTAAEEVERAREAASGMKAFLDRLEDIVQRHKQGQTDPGQPWDEHDYERFLRECDARTNKYGELLDKHGTSDEAQEIIAREMGWDRQFTEEEAEEQRRRSEELNAASEAALEEPEPEPEPEPDPHREGIDWIRAENGDMEHPLQHRCREQAFDFWRLAKRLGWDESDEGPLGEFLSEWQITGVKLAGALHGIASEVEFAERSFVVAHLKRALDHLHKSLASLEEVAAQGRLPAKMVLEARQQLFGIREGILTLMDDFRGRK